MSRIAAQNHSSMSEPLDELVRRRNAHATQSHRNLELGAKRRIGHSGVIDHVAERHQRGTLVRVPPLCATGHRIQRPPKVAQRERELRRRVTLCAPRQHRAAETRAPQSRAAPPAMHASAAARTQRRDPIRLASTKTPTGNSAMYARGTWLAGAQRPFDHQHRQQVRIFRQTATTLMLLHPMSSSTSSSSACRWRSAA
jgi:hypothetical protein